MMYLACSNGPYALNMRYNLEARNLKPRMMDKNKQMKVSESHFKL